MKSRQTTIPLGMRAEMEKDPEYKSCALFGQFDHVCEGRITWEHAIIVAGKKVQKKWAIPPLCAKAHEVDQFQDAGTMVKEINEWIALSRATDADLLSLFGEVIFSPFCKAKFLFQRREYLTKKYGKYDRKFPPAGTNLYAGPAPEPIVLSFEERAMIKDAKDFHFKNEGVRYSDRTMLREMIRSYSEDVKKLGNG